MDTFYFVLFSHSDSGWGNALSFKNLTDADISCIEQKIRRNGEAIESELNKSVDMDCEINKQHMVEIFGKYH